MTLELLVLAFIAGLAVIGLAMPLFIVLQLLQARRGPWSRLAKAYLFAEQFQGRRWRMRSIVLRPRVSYHSMVRVGAGPDGLYLASMLPAAGHRPMLIPWSDLSIEAADGRLRLIPGQLPDVRIELGVNLLMEIIDEAGEAWPAGLALVDEPVYE